MAEISADLRRVVEQEDKNSPFFKYNPDLKKIKTQMLEEQTSSTEESSYRHCSY